MKRTTSRKFNFIAKYQILYADSYRISVVDTLRLTDGTLFPIPIILDVSREDISNLEIKAGARLALRDPRDDEALAIITGKNG